MHVAICDDNVADRKQMERLLDRESTSRIKTTGNLYIDSYGNVEALMNSPMLYDLFYIDMTALPPHGMEIAIKLREKGVTAPIVLCISSINYRNYVANPENIFFLDKPIKKAELSESIDIALNLKKKAVPTIEIRGEEETYYIPEASFIYAYPDDHNMKIVLKDGRTICQLGGMRELAIAVQSFPSFLIIGKKYLVNENHIEKIKGKTAILSDTSKVPLALGDKRRILRFSGRDIPVE